MQAPYKTRDVLIDNIGPVFLDLHDTDRINLYTVFNPVDSGIPLEIDGVPAGSNSVTCATVFLPHGHYDGHELILTNMGFNHTGQLYRTVYVSVGLYEFNNTYVNGGAPDLDPILPGGNLSAQPQPGFLMQFNTRAYMIWTGSQWTISNSTRVRAMADYPDSIAYSSGPTLPYDNI